MVMPLWDENPFAAPVRPVVTWTLLALNVAIFAVQLGAPSDQVAEWTLGFGATPAAVLHLDPMAIGLQREGGMGWVWPSMTLVTYMFLHGDFGHLVGNMLFLWVFGDNIEQAIGRGRFLLFYLLCGIAAALVYVATVPHSTDPLIGASGAIAGIVAAYAMVRPCQVLTVLLFGIPLRLGAVWILGIWLIWQIWQIAGSSSDGVAYWAHIGGFVAGAILFPLLKTPDVRLFECLRPDSIKLETAPADRVDTVPTPPLGTAPKVHPRRIG